MYKVIDHTLYVEGVSTLELAKVYGTPLYVYSQTQIETQLNTIKEVFLNRYERTHAAYACKAFCSKVMCRLINEAGMWIDVVSAGEMYTALAAGFPAERIEFNGNNKTPEELIFAIEKGVGRIVVDSVQELSLLETVCTDLGRLSLPILFRITPNVAAKTHAYITTGKKDSKFGIPLEESVLFPLIEYAINSPQFDFLGFHFHVGSQLLTPETHISALEVVLPLFKEVQQRFGVDVKDFNMGGGFGIKYTQDDAPESLAAFVDPIMERLEAYCHAEGIKRPHVSMEPGRFIVGEAGLQLYTIGIIKEIPDIKTYVNVDGGMTDNMRVGLYDAKYNALIANKADVEKTSLVDISGKCCESTDILIKELHIAPPETGDILAVFSTGAYGYAMASTYNKLPIPSVVFVKDDTHRTVIRRQTYEDLLLCEVDD